MHIATKSKNHVEGTLFQTLNACFQKPWALNPLIPNPQTLTAVEKPIELNPSASAVASRLFAWAKWPLALRSNTRDLGVRE